MLYPHCWGNCNNRGIQVINSDEDDDGEPILPDDLVQASLSFMWRKTQVIFKKILDHKLQSDQDKVKRLCNKQTGNVRERSTVLPVTAISWRIKKPASALQDISQNKDSAKASRFRFSDQNSPEEFDKSPRPRPPDALQF
ncbi:hypothetical protein AVEN_134443-1 [Araneus ventricosus]|uniref:Uncharacterized protein n=1 Tax=Araneus ventricosus TaxID=182803 RepID=A0A4Y2K343_ARAVE|nr:hypothetical protein AVEN_134443-1 [Araneus ventricosus]